MSTYWFKSKSYGWGWTPATKQGWSITLFFVFLFSAGILIHSYFIQIFPQYIAFLSLGITIYQLTLISILVWICYKKGERPSWHWGKKKGKH